MKSLLLILSLLFTTTLLGKSSIQSKDAWIRKPIPGSQVTAAYLKIKNNSSKPKVLIGAKATLSKHVEIHQTKMVDGIMSMSKSDKIAIPPGASLELAPGGYHIMLMGISPSLGQKSEHSITLLFNDGKEEAVKFSVKSPN